MNLELIEKLSVVTAEEQAILDGGEVDMSMYSRAGDGKVEIGRLLPKGQQFGIRAHTRFAAFPRHSHDYVEAIYMCAGSTTHTIDGKTLVLRQGNILLMNQRTEHEIEAAGLGDIAVNLIMLPSFFDSAAWSLGGETALTAFLMGSMRYRRGAPGYLHYDITDDLPTRNLLEILVSSMLNSSDSSLLEKTMGLLLQYLSLRSDRLMANTEEERVRARVMRAVSRIETDMGCTLGSLAEAEGISDYALSRMIKQETGCTYTELLQTARFTKAAALLRETTLPIADISASVGYENFAFFYRRFQARYGCTPKEYRTGQRR